MRYIYSNAVIALALLPAFFILHNCNELFGFLPLRQIVFYTVLIYLVVFILYFVLKRRIGSSKTAVLLFFIFLFLLFFTPVHGAIKSVAFHTYSFFHPLLMILLFLLVIGISWKITRSSTVDRRLIYFLNITMICVVISEFFSLVINTKDLKRNGNLIYSSRELTNSYLPLKSTSIAKPDIYFLVFDEYTNAKTLEKIWHFNNQEINQWLGSKGFYVPTGTHGNYSFTLFSMSATFNMNYLDARGSDATVKKSLLQANQSLSDNELFSILEKENYKIHFLAPFKNRFGENGMGDWFDYIVSHQMDMQTLPGKLWDEVQTHFYNQGSANNPHSILRNKFEVIQRTLQQVNSTVNPDSNRAPQFVYGHFMIPHEPHLFDVDGKLLADKDDIPPLYKTYPAQINFVNDLIRQMVSEILQKNKRNTIIILEGDHGFREFLEGPNWFARTPDSVKQYFTPNFSAYYFPDSDYRRMYDTITPLNVFRVILNQYFHQNFRLLKDTSTLVKDE